jgi:hypothetical protein
MSETILAAEPTIRLVAFVGVLAAMALWEVAAPRRRREIPRVIRWTNNLALVVLDTVILRLSFPINRIFSSYLPWRDRPLGTDRAQPMAGHDGMTIGIEQFRTPRDLWLDRMLIQPLRDPASGGALDAGKEDTR